MADHCIPESWGSEIEVGVRTRLHNLEGYRTTVEYVKKAQNHSIDSYSAFGDVSFSLGKMDGGFGDADLWIESISEIYDA